MRLHRAFILGVLLLTGLPQTALAEWHFTPMIGVTFGKGTNLFLIGGTTEESDRSLGLTISRLGDGILGFEGGVVRTPRFFQSDTGDQSFIETSRVLTAMGNVVLTTPRLWTEYSLRPFVSGGVGLLDLLIDYGEDEGEPFKVDASVWGVNVGGGAIGFLSDRTGVRFEARYFSTLGRKDFGPLATPDGSPARLHFFTASIGLVIRTGS